MIDCLLNDQIICCQLNDKAMIASVLVDKTICCQLKDTAMIDCLFYDHLSVSIAMLPPFGPIEEHKWFFQISSQ
jgi:hypothetical protein